MEQSYGETVAASSPPKKRRGRPRKAERTLLLPGEVSDLAGVRQKRKKAFARPVSVSSRRKRQQGSSSAAVLQGDGGGASPEKEDTAPTVKVGQPVHGVVDGSFDAGYLVTVRVGDSDTVFRGVVFGPGMSLPLNRNNDVAPKMRKTSRDEAADAMANSTAAAATSVAQDDGTPLPTPAPAPAPASVSTSAPFSASFPGANEAHRASAMGGLGLGFRTPPPPAAPLSDSGYGSVAFRSPSFGQSPLQNAPGGFFFPPTHTPSPNSGINSHGFYPPRGFPYSFHFPRADFGGSQFATPAGPSPSPPPVPQGPSPSPSPSPSPVSQGGLPPCDS